MARVQTQVGLRGVMEDTYREHRIEVVSAYDARSDSWYVHVYVTGPTGIRTKVDVGGPVESQQEGFDHAFAEVQVLLDKV